MSEAQEKFVTADKVKLARAELEAFIDMPQLAEAVKASMRIVGWRATAKLLAGVDPLAPKAERKGKKTPAAHGATMPKPKATTPKRAAAHGATMPKQVTIIVQGATPDKVRVR